MKERRKGFIAGVVASAVFVGLIGTAAATIGSRTITADYNNIKISVNGSPIVPTDATGKLVEPFAVGGTTYLPVRAIGEALGADVEWDSSTSTVIINSGDSFDKKTSSYIWDTVLYADALKSLLSSASICVANGGSSAQEIQDISDKFYDEILPELERLRTNITNNTTYQMYMAAFDFTGAAEDAIYHFAEHEANPSTGTSNAFFNYYNIANNSYFEIIDLASNYYKS